MDGCIHDGWLAIQHYNRSFTTDFLYYSLSSPQVMRQYEEGAAGTSVKNLNKDIVGNLTIGCPALEEQEKIAKALGLVDSRLDALSLLLEKPWIAITIPFGFSGMLITQGTIFESCFRIFIFSIITPADLWSGGNVLF